MRPTARTLLAALPMLAALSMAPQTAFAQERDENWMENCRRWGGGNDRAVFCEEREARLPARGSLSVDGGDNGGVTVRAWDRNEVLVRQRVQAWARSEADARALAGRVRVSTDGTIAASGPRNERGQGWSVSYVVYVPRSTSLDVDTENGGISVEGISGTMRLDAVNGPLNLTRVAGDVRGRTVNGPLNVRLEGRRWSGAGLDVETTNGPVNLTLPEGYGAELSVGTTNGPVNFDIEVPVRGRVTRSINTTLGAGGPRIHASTVNGPVNLRRG